MMRISKIDKIIFACLIIGLLLVACFAPATTEGAGPTPPTKTDKWITTATIKRRTLHANAILLEIKAYQLGNRSTVGRQHCGNAAIHFIGAQNRWSLVAIRDQINKGKSDLRRCRTARR